MKWNLRFLSFRMSSCGSTYLWLWKFLSEAIVVWIQFLTCQNFWIMAIFIKKFKIIHRVNSVIPRIVTIFVIIPQKWQVWLEIYRKSAWLWLIWYGLWYDGGNIWYWLIYWWLHGSLSALFSDKEKDLHRFDFVSKHVSCKKSFV